MVSVGAVAQACNLTPRRVTQLVDEGMPRASRGRYDLGACLVWYVRYLQKIVESRGPRSTASTPVEEQMAEERLRTLRADAEMKELELARRRGEQVSVREAAELWQSAVERMRTRMLASVSREAVRCVGLGTLAEAHAVVEGMVHAALGEVVAVADDIERDGDGSAGAVGARAEVGGSAAPAARERVGRRAARVVAAVERGAGTVADG